MTKLNTLASAIGIALAALLGMLPPLSLDAHAADYFAGKTITIIVGVVPGGSVDGFIRMLAKYLPQHIPGKPAIIVQNMPGAGGLVATNYLYERAKPDGQTLMWYIWDPLAQALDNPSMRARYEKFSFLGGIGDTRVLYVNNNVVPGGMKDPADIVKADQVVVGALNSTDWTGLLTVLSLDVLGVRQKIIAGYRGGTDVFMALQRGEVQIHNTSIVSFNSRVMNLVGEGRVSALAYLAAVDRDGKFALKDKLENVVAFPDLYRRIHGRAPSGPDWDALNWLVGQTGDMAYVGFIPPGTPPDIVQILQNGYAGAFSDPEFVAQSTAMNGQPYRIVSVEHGNATIRDLTAVSPAVLATLRQKMDRIGR